MSKCTIVVVILGFYSCSFKDDSEFVSTLTSSNSCWVFYSNPEGQLNNEKVTVAGCAEFYNDYTFAPFIVCEETSSELRSLDKDTSNRGEWTFSAEDSTFSVEEQVFKIVMFNADTITLIDDKGFLKKMIKAQLKGH